MGKGKPPDKLIRQGSRITYMMLRKNNLRFIDSMSFFTCPLEALSETFNINTLKGHFPHKFNTLENQNYKGPIPSADYYGADSMKIEKRTKFDKWYETVKDTSDWCFRDEFIKYCEDDVLLLIKSVLAFRKIILEKLDIDPFKYITLASLSMDCYINKFLPERTIVGCSNRKQSFESIEWLNYLNNKNIIPEVPVTVKNKQFASNKFFKKNRHTFTCDGLDSPNKIAYEFNGCKWHGCPKCYSNNKCAYEKNNGSRAFTYGRRI